MTPNEDDYTTSDDSEDVEASLPPLGPAVIRNVHGRAASHARAGHLIEAYAYSLFPSEDLNDYVEATDCLDQANEMFVIAAAYLVIAGMGGDESEHVALGLPWCDRD